MVRKRKQRPVHSGEKITLIPIGSVEGPIIDFLIEHLPQAIGKRVDDALASGQLW
jgi:hypothetical protein